MRLLSHPSTGMGTPQSMSRVMARSCSPSVRMPSVQLATALRQCVWAETHSLSRWLKALRRRKKCSSSRHSGAEPQILQRGLSRSGALRGAAGGAGALDVAVREEAVVLRAVGEGHRSRVDVVALQQAEEDVLGGAGVVLRAGGGEQIEGDAEALPGIEELGVEAAGEAVRRQPFGLGADGYGRAVLVAAGDHEDTVAEGALVAGEYGRGEVGADDLTGVEGAVGVGPGDADEYLFRHGIRLDCSTGLGLEHWGVGAHPPLETCPELAERVDGSGGGGSRDSLRLRSGQASLRSALRMRRRVRDRSE